MVHFVLTLALTLALLLGQLPLTSSDLIDRYTPDNFFYTGHHNPPTFQSLLVHTNIVGTVHRPNGKIWQLSRTVQDTTAAWSIPYSKHVDLVRGAAPKTLEDRDIWDAHVDYLLTNYVSLVETFLHAHLRTHNVKTEYILGHTGFHYEKARALASIFADPRVKTVCEIGFNAGHSALNALLAREGIQVISFDLGEYWDSYSKHSYQLLSNNFPNQLTLVMGDSTDTVPHFIRERPDQKCNILFVDGGHTKDVAAADIANMAPLANHTFHRLIVDDADWGPVREAWDEAVAGGMVKETGVVASNYCSAYDMLYATDATFGLDVPILSPSEDSGPANPDILSPTGAMPLGEYAV